MFRGEGKMKVENLEKLIKSMDEVIEKIKSGKEISNTSFQKVVCLALKNIAKMQIEIIEEFNLDDNYNHSTSPQSDKNVEDLMGMFGMKK